MTKNFEAFLKLDKSKFQNKYVIIVKGKVVARGKNIEKMVAQVRKKYPEETPLVAKILDERMLVVKYEDRGNRIYGMAPQHLERFRE
ncbi:MAG: DUF5678 domain-containing protein [candidate division Zixibacteria bacterium]|nr:DUF5678 domain-containing protein [candidate division Zixibacteria bacterium]